MTEKSLQQTRTRPVSGFGLALALTLVLINLVALLPGIAAAEPPRPEAVAKAYETLEKGETAKALRRFQQLDRDFDLGANALLGLATAAWRSEDLEAFEEAALRIIADPEESNEKRVALYLLGLYEAGSADDPASAVNPQRAVEHLRQLARLGVPAAQKNELEEAIWRARMRSGQERAVLVELRLRRQRAAAEDSTEVARLREIVCRTREEIGDLQIREAATMKPSQSLVAPVLVSNPVPRFLLTESGDLETSLYGSRWRLFIDHEGCVGGFEAVSGVGIPDQEKGSTFLSWTFEPALLDGEPIAVWYDLNYGERRDSEVRVVLEDS